MLDLILAGHNTFFAGGIGSGKSFRIEQICEHSNKTLSVTSTTGPAAKVLKNKAKTIHAFAGIDDCFFFICLFASKKCILKIFWVQATWQCMKFVYLQNLNKLSMRHNW